MGFEEGNSVEVFKRVHEPCGSWFPGYLISVDGDCYIVRYYLLADPEGEPVIEKVHKEDVRPQPPSKRKKRWMVGDVAEVFDIQRWRFGKIVKVLKNNDLFVIRLFGSIQLKEFHESKLRIHQTWNKNKWSVMEKVAQNKEPTKESTENESKLSGSLSNSSPAEVIGEGSRLRKRDRKTHPKDKQKCLPARMISRSNTYYCLERACKDLRKCHRPLTRKLPLFRQVDDISSQKARADEKFKEGIIEMDAYTAKRATDWLCNSPKSLSTEESDQCSVASCSSNNFCDFPSHNCCKALEAISDNSDAESSSFPCSSVNISSTPYFEQKLEANIHELEFQAYKSTVRALYASGPLSWEQESLLTNLRLSLHISDEEHLLQLKHLLST
ncbi:uncharacterized protein LOC8274714 isoform X2 [Ricinus communis]|uniref:RNA binding protein, putative n=1 Tax=Ricinus communis TaxID=3988 RepID=B9S4Q9_RICCO|nr:uncharacterized protein LOC8274714 isoform X2 [Ricinus communis]EEF41383.1 RNA binding protein, putative [Ricinus communis]|eukprot:XP_025013442.1 uncharacterized protein LOC8274714 isoform X2 [Ricinus communis]